MPENQVQIDVGVGGALVRTDEVTELQPTGALAVVEQQVMVLADANGNPIDFDKIIGLLSEIATTNKEILKQMRGGLL